MNHPIQKNDLFTSIQDSCFGIKKVLDFRVGDDGDDDEDDGDVTLNIRGFLSQNKMALNVQNKHNFPLNLRLWHQLKTNLTALFINKVVIIEIKRRVFKISYRS